MRAHLQLVGRPAAWQAQPLEHFLPPGVHLRHLQQEQAIRTGAACRIALCLVRSAQHNTADTVWHGL